ncbi:MAG: type VI secretion system tube protein Hcp [Acidobacteriota bacterium]
METLNQSQSYMPATPIRFTRDLHSGNGLALERQAFGLVEKHFSKPRFHLTDGSIRGEKIMLQLMFLKLDGVRGESYAPRHIGEIEISGYNWNTKHQANAGSGAGTGKVSITDLTVFKPTDKTSAFLRVASANGQYFANGVLTIEKVSVRGDLLRTMIIKMKDIILDFVLSNGAVDDIGLNFASMEYKES